MTTSRIIRLAALAGIAVTTATAQSESELKSFFEGKRVTVKMEMPATKWGIDVTYGSRSSIDFDSYSTRIKRYGVALRPGESVLITTVKVKEKLIEFQLAGGGYGTLGDDTDTHVYVADAPKSHREKFLEHALRHEDDRKVRRRMEWELEQLRRARQRENELARVWAVQASQAKAEAVRERALEGGSRFNLRFPSGYLKENPPTPEMIMEALAEFVDFAAPDSSSDSAALRDRRR